MNVIIAGGSGMLGRAITQKLQELHHPVAWFSRTPSAPAPKGVSVFMWNPDQLWCDVRGLEWADAVINLAGESIGDTPWNQDGRSRILNSRIQSVRTLAKGLTLVRKPGLHFVGVSGAGYYGTATRHAHSEQDAAGRDFPARVAKAWEVEYEVIRSQNPASFAILRLAVVLAKEGGALPQILTPFRLGFGAVLGSGKQAFNWIHIDDAARIFVEALHWNGVYNVSAPAKDTNRSMSRILFKILGKWNWLPPVPGFLLRLALGQRSDLVLKGNWSRVDALVATGYAFQYPELENALQNLVISPASRLKTQPKDSPSPIQSKATA